MTSPLGTCQAVVQLCYMGDLQLVFWEVSPLISRLDVSVYNPIKSKWGFLFPYITNSICFQVFSIYFISFVHVNVLYMYFFFIFNWFFKIYFCWLYMDFCTWCWEMTGENIGSHKTGIIDHCKLPCGYFNWIKILCKISVLDHWAIYLAPQMFSWC